MQPTEYKKTINPYGNKWHQQYEEDECANCGICGIPEYLIFESGFPDGIPICGYDCLLDFAHEKWKSHVIEYVNSKDTKSAETDLSSSTAKR